MLVFQYFGLPVSSISIRIKYLNIDFELVQCILPSCISYLYTIPLKCNVALASEIRLGDCQLRGVELISFASIYPVYFRMKTHKQSRCLALLISDQPIVNKSTSIATLHLGSTVYYSSIDHIEIQVCNHGNFKVSSFDV